MGGATKGTGARMRFTISRMMPAARAMMLAAARLHIAMLKSPMQLALAQLDQMVGDLAANARDPGGGGRGRRVGATLVVTPELSLCGYPPEDLLLRPAFLEACAASWRLLPRR